VTLSTIPLLAIGYFIWVIIAIILVIVIIGMVRRRV
jgi:hypothetical protein